MKSNSSKASFSKAGLAIEQLRMMLVVLTLVITLNVVPTEAIIGDSTALGSNLSFIGVSAENNLVIQPPSGGKTVVNNFQDLIQTKAELSTTLIQINVTKAELSVATSQLNATLLRLSSVESAKFGSIFTSAFTLDNSPLPGITSPYSYIGGDVKIINNKNMFFAAFPFLENVIGSITISANPMLSNISFPVLSYLGGNASFIIIESNAPSMSVSLFSFNLTTGIASYWIYAANMNCSALAPRNCSPELSTKIAVLGGDLGNNTLFFSLANPQWSTTTIPPLSTPRYRYPAAALCPKFNLIYIAGGIVGPTYLSSAAKLLLDTLQWTNIPSMQTARGYTAGVCLDDGVTFLVCGGNNGGYLASCEKFSSGATWSSAKNMSIARYTPALVLFKGQAIALGGYDDASSSYLNSAEQYDSTANSWSSFPAFNVPRGEFGAAVILPNKIFIAGGRNQTSTVLNSVEFYIIGSTAWTILPSTLPAGPRAYCASVSLQNKLVVLGGTRTQVDVYDPATDSWSTLTPFSSPSPWWIAPISFG